MGRLTWTLEDAVALLRELEPLVASVGYHVGVLGSVLIQGQSQKDLDILLYPHNSSHQNTDRVRDVLREAGLELDVSADQVHAKWWNSGSTDTKYVEVWSYKGRRVDFFYLT